MKTQLESVDNQLLTPSHFKQKLNWYLVLVGPEGADGQIHLVPLLGVRARRVPHGDAQGTPVDPHVGPQGPRTVAVAAVQKVAELDAVCVVLAERLQQQLSPVTCGMLGRVHQHVGSCTEREIERGRARGEGKLVASVHHSAGMREAVKYLKREYGCETPVLPLRFENLINIPLPSGEDH